MELINFFTQYVYIPLFLLFYKLHIDVVELKSKINDFNKMGDDIDSIKKDVHHLVQVHKENILKEKV